MSAFSDYSVELKQVIEKVGFAMFHLICILLLDSK